MSLGVLFPEPLEESPRAFAARAESLGYDALWVGELWGRDAFVTLADAACADADLALGTAVANVFSRSPAVLAGAAASLARRAAGEVRLGVGPSTEKAVSDLHGAEYDRPVRRTHEAAELARAFTAGEGRVDYDGEVFSVADFPALDADVPVYAAALGPAARRMAGRVADGWLPHNVPFDRLDAAFETVADAAEAADRDPDAVRVAPYVPAAASDDGDAARDAVRGHLAYYVGSAESYRRAVATAFPDAADRVAEAWRAGDREAARGAVTDEMVAALGAAGTPAEARDRLAAVAALDAVDEPIVVVPSGADAETARETVAALAPESG